MYFEQEKCTWLGKAQSKIGYLSRTLRDNLQLGGCDEYIIYQITTLRNLIDFVCCSDNQSLVYAAMGYGSKLCDLFEIQGCFSGCCNVVVINQGGGGGGGSATNDWSLEGNTGVTSGILGTLDNNDWQLYSNGRFLMNFESDKVLIDFNLPFKSTEDGSTSTEFLWYDASTSSSIWRFLTSSTVSAYFKLEASSALIYATNNIDSFSATTYFADYIVSSVSYNSAGSSLVQTWQTLSFESPYAGFYVNQSAQLRISNFINNTSGIFSTSSLTGNRTYTLPDASGTLALTSDFNTYVPTSREITINGVTQDLSANRSWIISTSSGTVTLVSVGNLSPLFTTSVSNPSTTPSISFSQVSQSQNLVFASPNGSSGNPAFRALVLADLPSGLGTVTSVGLSLGATLSSIFSVAGSPITSSGSFTLSAASQSQNLVYASPNGASGTPTFRTLVSADLPAGTGTVTSVSVANLSPLFTASVATATTTPSVTFSQVSQSQNLVFASPNGSSGNPTFRALVASDLPSGLWLLGGNSLAANGVIGSTTNFPVSVQTNGAEVVRFLSDGLARVNYLTIQSGINNVGVTISTDGLTGGIPIIFSTKGGVGITFNSPISCSTFFMTSSVAGSKITIANSGNQTNTDSAYSDIRMSCSYVPSGAGVGSFTQINLTPTFNHNASGVTQRSTGILWNPTLTNIKGKTDFLFSSYSYGSIDNNVMFLRSEGNIQSLHRGNLQFFTSSAVNMQGGDGIMYIAQATASPSGNPPSGGFFMWSDGTNLKVRNSAGTTVNLI